MPRVLIAALLGLSGFVAYVAAAVVVADRVSPLNWMIQLLYFVVAGMLWVIPARWLMLWGAGGRRALRRHGGGQQEGTG